ncbi:MAG: IseA DL-endopeptidase inhibitor family protein [Oscillospiraceae bacterium]|nr:IseA DL-endopeptidase inhibitor family protein [Oscillospiraceae bacterium]
MKRSEKLFLAINEIDGDIVEEAKPKEEKPIQMKPEPRSPMKGIIALAACVAALAVGIFAIVKFKLGGDIESVPVQNGSDSFASDSTDSEYNSSDTDSADNGSEIDLTLTEEDLELQAILKELVPKAEEIDGMFGYLSPSGDKYTINFGRSPDGMMPYENTYYLVSEDMRTGNSMFAVPQSYDEMEKLISEYFSSQAAEDYMQHIGHGTLKEERDGILYVTGGGRFIEMNGNMYFSTDLDKPYYDGINIKYEGMGIDCETAKVTRQTDTIIEFTYWGRCYHSYDEYSEKEGILVKENGAWKLRYFYYNCFAPEIPVEFTEQDLELCEILKGLEPGNKTTDLFIGGLTKTGTEYQFVTTGITGNSREEYITGYFDLSSAEQEFDYPRSRDEFEQRLLPYFTREATDQYMNNVTKGLSMTQSDIDFFIYSVTVENNSNPIYIELDGKMYYRWDTADHRSRINYDTVKVIDRTDDTIVFSHVNIDGGSYHPKTERLVYERGGWKRDPFYQ